MSDNGHVEVSAPTANSGAAAPTPGGGSQVAEAEVATIHLGAMLAPRILVALMSDGTPILYQRKEP